MTHSPVRFIAAQAIEKKVVTVREKIYVFIAAQAIEKVRISPDV